MVIKIIRMGAFCKSKTAVSSYWPYYKPIIKCCLSKFLTSSHLVVVFFIFPSR